MDKMKYKTTREKAYYQLGYCAGYGEMAREIRAYLELEEEDNNEMLTKLQEKLKIKTLDGSMANDELLVR